MVERFAKYGLFEPIFMISGLTGDGVADLKRHLAQALPQGSLALSRGSALRSTGALAGGGSDARTDLPAAREELPYASTVETERWEERKDGSARIEQTIFVERPSQKAIVLGEGGRGSS